MNDLIDKDEMFSMLLKSLPGAKTAWQEHQEDSEGEDVPYLGMAVLARQIIEMYQGGKTHSFPAVFSLLERMLLHGNDDVKALISVGLIECLQNVSSHTQQGYAVFEPWLEPNTLHAWREIEQVWEGKTSLAEVVTEEMKRENEY